MVLASELSAWQNLRDHYDSKGRDIVVKDLFAQEKDERFQKFSRYFQGPTSSDSFLFDFSKNIITDETFELLIALARKAGVEEMRDRMFAGEHINFTEDRAVLHVALRNIDGTPIKDNGVDVMPEVFE